jgi:hypothetical protein
VFDELIHFISNIKLFLQYQMYLNASDQVSHPKGADPRPQPCSESPSFESAFQSVLLHSASPNTHLLSQESILNCSISMETPQKKSKNPAHSAVKMQYMHGFRSVNQTGVICSSSDCFPAALGLVQRFSSFQMS